MTHYYEIECQRENEFDGLLSIQHIVNIKPNKKKMQYNTRVMRINYSISAIPFATIKFCLRQETIS